MDGRGTSNGSSSLVGRKQRGTLAASAASAVRKDGWADAPACTASATRDSDYVRVNLYKPGTNAGDGVGTGDPSRTLIQLVARYNG